MITSIRYNSFKSLIDTELPIEPLTILLGTNASGKTNTLEGLNFLSGLTTGAEISQALVGGEIRGDAKGCPPFGTDAFSLACDFDSPIEGYGDECRYEIAIKKYQVPLIDSEKLEFLRGGLVRTPPLFLTEEEPNSDTQSIHVLVDNFKRGGRKPGLDFMARLPILFQLLSRISTDFERRGYEDWILDQHKKIIKHFSSLLSSILIIDPKPDVIRRSGYIDKSKHFMDKDCSQLSAVLFQLCQDTDIKNKLEQFLRELPEHSVLGFEFDTTTRDEVKLAIKELFQGVERTVPIEVLSDGTLRLLAVLGTAFSIPAGGLMVVEEIDTSLHPSKVARLLTLLNQIAVSRGVRLLLTSHNPALMDAVERSSWKAVILCYREKESGISKLIRLTDIPNAPSALATNSLGNLVTKGVLRRLVRDKSSSNGNLELNFNSWLAKLESIGD